MIPNSFRPNIVAGTNRPIAVSLVRFIASEII